MVTKIFDKKLVGRKRTTNKEMFFFICSALKDTGFSSHTNFILLKRRFHRFFTLSSNTKSINLKLKMSRSNFKRANNSAVLNGFYRAV
jgi:hypothetical protein